MQKTAVEWRISDWSSDVWSSDLLRLHRLTALGRDEIGNELQGLANNIAEYLAILGDRVKLYAVMREEFEAIRDEFATPRRSTIAPAADGIEDEDLIEHEDMVVTVTLQGYIKRTSLDSFPAQASSEERRVGKKGGSTGRSRW